MITEMADKAFYTVVTCIASLFADPYGTKREGKLIMNDEQVFTCTQFVEIDECSC